MGRDCAYAGLKGSWGLRRELSFHSSGLINKGISSTNIYCSNKVGFLRFLGHSLMSTLQPHHHYQNALIAFVVDIMVDAILKLKLYPMFFFS